MKIEYNYDRQHIEQEEVQLNMSSFVKILAEKAITSECYETTILLLNMSKAFDTVKRNNLMELLKTILDPDETHMMKILLKDIKLSVRIGKEFSKKFTTNIDVPQGDYLSSFLFTLYLAGVLKTER